MGLEPIRQRHTPLKRACLPIPALPHLLSCCRFGVFCLLPDDDIYYSIQQYICQAFFQIFLRFFQLFFKGSKNDVPARGFENSELGIRNAELENSKEFLKIGLEKNKRCKSIWELHLDFFNKHLRNIIIPNSEFLIPH